MSHDRFNTRGGEIGFVVELADGAIVREDEATWDEVKGPIRSLAVAHLPTHRQNGHAYVVLRDCERFFFSNVAAAHRASGHADQGQHVGKVIGGCKGERALLFDLRFVGTKIQHTRTEVAACDLGYSPHAFKQGAL